MNEKLNIILNGKNVTGYKGETILQLARRNNIDIPTLCNDPRLEPYSSCYVCVVEVSGMKGLQPSCSTKLNEGMIIQTDNERIVKARKTALDLMLSNHYADCIGPCKETCPAGVDVQAYISLIEKGLYHEAVAVIKETNPFPAVCGRVCVRPCEVACRRNLLDEGAAVGIDYLKRFAADMDLNSDNKWKPSVKEETNKKVAIIGGGPGGLAAAFFLRKEGHTVDVFESAPKAGGWLRYGIPEYRLPNDLLQAEINNIIEMGVTIHFGKRLGENISFSDIKESYDAGILAIGSQKGSGVGVPGDDAENVFSGIDFLKNMEITGKKYDFANKTVAVVGGGNTAMDCCRTAIRCGAKKVYVIYRRTENEMPANPIEIHESKLEGVEYMFLTNPKQVNKNEKGVLKSITLLRMELGEPDSSGRRRPVPVDGSEFDLEVDFILAAIGQKTDINFLQDISKAYNQELNASRWGDIEANPETLQTSIKSIFACGDSVTGPATLIEAIGQAKIAARSCNQYLNGLEVVAPKKEFLSKKSNFKSQNKEDYNDRYEHQLREEMPTLPPAERFNFKEVELGYANEETAIHETQRCLECGCIAYYDCDLKKYAGTYHAEQTKYNGEFKEYSVDFRHPYIEIDNNKCILCARCVRICKEVVGANALGLVNRGFETVVQPSMGNSLTDTYCESCGMCISTCPTGAISENVLFKPGPVKTEKHTTICNYCSVGCEIELHHRGNYVMKVEGSKGLINVDGNICRFPRFGYHYLNDKSRIMKPLIKEGGKFKEIEFSDALMLIANRLKTSEADSNAFYAGARLTNEEMYLIQKIARTIGNTNNVSSFHYLGRGNGYIFNSLLNVPFDQIDEASRIYIIGSEINKENAVAGYMIHNAHYKHSIPITLITTKKNNTLTHKTDETITISSYYHFLKAANHYLLSHNLQNSLFINDNCENFENYKADLLKENFDELLKLSGIGGLDVFKQIIESYNKEQNAIIVFSEKEISGYCSYEIFNLAFITGKLGKTASGIISLKEKNNSQGLIDMGIFPKYSTGTEKITEMNVSHRLKKKWQIATLPEKYVEDQRQLLDDGAIKNMFIFGEDPIGCATSKEEVLRWFETSDFVVVQDYFMTETAKEADLILPASLPSEISGSFSNTQKVLQKFDKSVDSKLEMSSVEQLSQLLEVFGHHKLNNVDDIMMEVISILPNQSIELKHRFVSTHYDNNFRIFNYGCDNVVKRFEESFEERFKKTSN